VFFVSQILAIYYINAYVFSCIRIGTWTATRMRNSSNSNKPMTFSAGRRNGTGLICLFKVKILYKVPVQYRLILVEMQIKLIFTYYLLSKLYLNCNILYAHNLLARYDAFCASHPSQNFEFNSQQAAAEEEAAYRRQYRQQYQRDFWEQPPRHRHSQSGPDETRLWLLLSSTSAIILILFVSPW
jgi:hypothetical protein